jgi:hypothetical protein
MLPSPRRPLALALAASLLCACREGSDQGGAFLPIIATGTQGCAPAGDALSVQEIFQSPDFGELSQLVAATGTAGTDTLYWSARDGSIHELSLPSGGGASDAVLLAAGEIEAQYLVPASILAPARISGLALVDASFLAVAEHASNTVLLVDRAAPVEVRRLVGTLSEAGGFSPVPGTGGPVLFRFTSAVPMLVDLSGFLWIGDTGNHSVRRFLLGSVPPAVDLVAGSGAPGKASGALATTLLDTPSGFASSCAGELLVAEAGAAGLGGHVLTSLRVGGASFFGGFEGDSMVLAGDGLEETLQGVGSLARLAAPSGLASSDDGRVFWVDSSAAPILRRFDFASGLADCPLFADCADALSNPSPFVGENFALALGESGALYVLATTTGGGGRLYRVE